MAWLWSRGHILPTGRVTTLLPRRRSTSPILLIKLPCPTELSLSGRGSRTWPGWAHSTFFLQKFLEEVQAASGDDGIADKWTPTSECLGPFIDLPLTQNYRNLIIVHSLVPSMHTQAQQTQPQSFNGLIAPDR